MQTLELVIAPAAKDDLKGIYKYGLRQWGELPAEQYLAGIKEKLRLLIQQPLMGVERLDVFANMRSAVIRSHTLFYRITNTQIEIVRVLHSRQDPKRHLK